MANFTFDSDTMELLQANGVSAFVNGKPVTEGMSIGTFDTVTAETDSKHAFEVDNPNITSNPVVGFWFRYRDSSGVPNGIFSTDISELTKVKLPRIGQGVGNARFTLVIKVEELAGGGGDGGELEPINNSYLMDVKTMRDFNKLRVVNSPQEGTINDYGQYILSLLRLPFKIDDEAVGDPVDIIVGSINTELKTPEILVDRLVIDMGEVTLPTPKTFKDYTRTKFIVNLPYINSVVLDGDFGVGEVVSLRYYVSLQDGQTEAVLSSERKNGVFQTVRGVIGRTIPINNDFSSPKLLEGLGVDMGSNNGFLAFSIDMLEMEENGVDSPFDIPIKDYGKLPDKGFVKVTEGEFQTLATFEEEVLILEALKEGVILK